MFIHWVIQKKKRKKKKHCIVDYEKKEFENRGKKLYGIKSSREKNIEFRIFELHLSIVKSI